MIEAAPPLAELSFRVAARASPLGDDFVGKLAIACSDLADGFAAPPASRRRIDSHRRAWIAIRELDQAVGVVRRLRRAPADVVKRAQRAIDRADVLVGALLPA